MSLQLLAKQMEAKGRKGDSMLVHMTPDEVAGLQKLAESAGGSLTINPETGLVEANFLKRMLPTLVGAGLMMIPGVGLGAAVAGGALTGGIQAKRNDQDVGMGALLGGLGAYGGASMAGAFGAGAAGTTASTAANTAANTSNVANTATTATAANPVAITPSNTALSAELNAMGGTGQIVPTTAPPTALTPPPASSITNANAISLPNAAPVTPPPPPPGGLEAITGKQMMAAAAPLAAPEKMEEPEEFVEDDEMYYTEYTPGQTGERSSTSTEARQLAERRFSPMESINASEYRDRVRRRNIYSAAEGGEVADAGIAGGIAGNTGATANAMSYLMGQSPSTTGATAPGTPSASQAGLQYLMGQAPQSSAVQPQAQRTEFVMPTRGESVTNTLDGYREITQGPNMGMYETVDGKLAFDPQAQKYYRTDNVFRYEAPPPEPEPAYDPYYHGGAAAGGLVGLAKGGMKSGGFVIPADVVSMIGEGNTDAGYSRIKSMVPGATAIKGKDGGQADTVKTHIEGKQPARVAHGEMYVPPETVKRMGGAKKLYAMMDRVRDQATGSKKQIKPVSLKKALA